MSINALAQTYLGSCRQHDPAFLWRRSDCNQPTALTLLWTADSGADFSQARLFKADLSESIMDGARFNGADLTRADLRYCNLTRNDLADATLDFAVLNHLSPQSPLISQRLHFGKWLKGQREARGLTPDQMADELGCGLTGYDVETFLECKDEGVTKYLAGRLAMILNVPVAEVPTRRDT